MYNVSGLENILEDIHELEEFLHATLIPALDQQKLRQGDDLLRYAKELNLRIPRSIRGLPNHLGTDSSDSSKQPRTGSIVLLRPA